MRKVEANDGLTLAQYLTTTKAKVILGTVIEKQVVDKIYALSDL